MTTQATPGREDISFIGYVPEPSTWALMLAGFGMMAYALRGRSKVAYTA
ncbi:PEPxxWA-CTERM sorting domain-containing protein [Sphingomonas sp. Tas61C01]